MALLEVRGLVRRPWIVDFDLSLERGEVACLRGPSGAGKSLLLRSLADLDPIDGGELELDGRSRAEFAPRDWRRAVVYVHQSGVRLHGSVAENLARVAAVAGVAIAPAPGLDPDADADRLSGGEAQRLALHRALALEPAVLLLDEATSALDADLAREWEERVRAHVRAGNAVLWITHDDALVARLGAREVRPW